MVSLIDVMLVLLGHLHGHAPLLTQGEGRAAQGGRRTAASSQPRRTSRRSFSRSTARGRQFLNQAPASPMEPLNDEQLLQGVRVR